MAGIGTTQYIVFQYIVSGSLGSGITYCSVLKRYNIQLQVPKKLVQRNCITLPRQPLLAGVFCFSVNPGQH